MIKITILHPMDPHSNFSFEIPEMGISMTIDSQWLLLTQPGMRGYVDEIEPRLISILSFWNSSIVDLSEGESIFLPIELSDDYTGGLIVFAEDRSILKVSYGYSIELPGAAGNPLIPATEEEMSDLEIIYDSMRVSKSDMLGSIQNQINELNRQLGRK